MARLVGMVLSLSSTAIVLQTLNEGANQNRRRTVVFLSVLLFQDIAVIPMLAPLTSAGGERRFVGDSSCQWVIFVAAEQHGSALRVGNKPAGDGNGRWHYCRRTVSDAPSLRFIAATRLQEILRRQPCYS